MIGNITHSETMWLALLFVAYVTTNMMTHAVYSKAESSMTRPMCWSGDVWDTIAELFDNLLLTAVARFTDQSFQTIRPDDPSESRLCVL
jgi:hypothetical protein